MRWRAVLVWLGLAIASRAHADSLQLIAPSHAGAGVPVAISVRAIFPDGGISVGHRGASVGISSDSATSLFASNENQAAWTSSFTANLPSDGGAASFFFTDVAADHSAQLTASASGSSDGTLSIALDRFALNDDGEGDDAGWTKWYAPQFTSITYATDAGHTGSGAIHFVDGDGGDGTTDDGDCHFTLAPITGSLFARTWFRYTEQSDGGATPIFVFHRAGSSQVVAETQLDLFDHTVSAGGADPLDGGTTQWVPDDTPKQLLPGSYHLVELGLQGIGSSSGVREMYIDGQLFSMHGVDWTGWSVSDFYLGELLADRVFVGTLDFDDVRLSVLPMASHFGFSAPTRVIAGHCVAMNFFAEDSNGAPVTDDVTAAQVVAPALNFFSDSNCTQATSNVMASGEGVYLQALARGAAQLGTDCNGVPSSDACEDLLAGAATIQVTGEPFAISFASAPVTVAASACSPPISIALVDDAGAEVLLDQPIAVSLSADAGIFSDPNCTSGISSLAVSSEAQLYVASNTAGALPITASATGLQSANQTEQVTSSSISISPAMQAVNVGDTVTLQVGALDAGSESFAWFESSGPTGIPELLDAGGASVQFTARVPGDYGIAVRATGGASGAMGAAQVHVNGTLDHPSTSLRGCGDGALSLAALGALLSLLRRRAGRAS